MGYAKTITARVELLYGKYFDLIAEIPSTKSITFPFSSRKQCRDARQHIYNWIDTNKYQGYYSLNWSDDKLSLTITNNDQQSRKLPSPSELQDYLYSLPFETMFETTLSFIKHFQLLPDEELNKLVWLEPDPQLAPTNEAGPDNAKQPAHPSIWNWEETEEEE